MNFLKSDKGIILLLILIFFALLPFFYMKQNFLLTDTGREYYVPWEILNGKVLYKDIFNNFYAPFAFLFNAFIMLIFGQKLNVLYHCGIINSLCIIVTIYLLAREFLNKSFSFFVAVFVIFALVYRNSIFNSNLPYSFSLVYALSSFLLSLLFIIKYSKNGNKNLAYLACFFAGLSIANKYEFILYPFLIMWVIFFLKPLKLKENIIAVFCFLIMPAICILILFIQGVRYSHLIYTVELTRNLVNAPALKIFYSNIGVFFDASKYGQLILRHNIFSVFALIPLVNIFLFAFNYKKLIEDKQVLILFSCFILASAKSIFYINIGNIGIFLLPLCFLMLIVLLDRLKIKFLPLLLIISILIFAVDDFKILKHKKFKLRTEKGKIYSYRREGRIIDYAVNFIKDNTKNTDRIVVLPEGSIINFITERKSNDMYFHLNPLIYNDVYGENKIIADFKKDLPEYFIIVDINYKDYGCNYFLIGYAENFYEQILSGYNSVMNEKHIQIYKRKDIND